MGTTMNRHTYERMIEENRAWLMGHPKCCEREHIDAVLAESADHLYGKLPSKELPKSVSESSGRVYSDGADPATDADGEVQN